MTIFKAFILALAIFVLTITGNAQKSVNFSGTVLNGSQDSSAVANLDIELQKIAGGKGMPSIIQTAQSNSRGQFSFTLADADTGSIYVFGANHQNVHYYSNTIKLLADTKNVQQNLVIYDTTNSTAGVSAFMHHLFLEDDGRSISVRETVVLTNPTDKTIVGSVHEHGIGDAALKFQLPVGAQNFTSMERNTGVDLVKNGDFVFDKGVFVPGNRQVSYVYQIPWHRNSIQTVLNFSYDATSFDIFINNPNLRLFSQQLVDHGPFNIRGVPYRRLGTMNVKAGTRIELAIERDGSVEQNPVPILLITSLLLGLALVYGLAQKSTRSAKQPTGNKKSLESRKQDLIKKIVKLDTEIAEKPSSAKSEERAQLFNQLQKVAIELSKSVKEFSRKKK